MYGPYRNVVREVAKKQKLLLRRSRGCNLDWKTFIKTCLRGFAKIKKAVLHPWRCNVGKSVSFHHGMLAFLQSNGVIKKLKRKPRKIGEDRAP